MKEKELANAPLLIFANKQDLVQALQPDEVAFLIT
jgi:signal recognition particle receptor subunit beta